jgi:AbiV family abortive infection protein
VAKANIPVPDLDALGDLAIAAAQNARRLLTDAEIMIKRHRWPTAYSLAVLAFEETGKAWLCTVAMFIPDEFRHEFPFGAIMTGHLPKLQAAHGLTRMLAYIRGGEGAPASILVAVGALEVLAQDDNRAKQRGLYADFTDGVVWNPSQVTEDEARSMAVVVRDVLDRAGPLASPEFIAWLAHTPDNAGPERDALLGRVIAAVGKGGAQAIVEALQEEYSKMDGLAEMLAEDERRVAQEDRVATRRAGTKAKARRKGCRRSRRRR